MQKGTPSEIVVYLYAGACLSKCRPKNTDVRRRTPLLFCVRKKV